MHYVGIMNVGDRVKVKANDDDGKPAEILAAFDEDTVGRKCLLVSHVPGPHSEASHSQDRVPLRRVTNAMYRWDYIWYVPGDGFDKKNARVTSCVMYQYLFYMIFT